MAEPTYSVVGALAELAQAIKLYVPRCNFFFGEEEDSDRNLSPPCILWAVVGGSPAPANDARTPISGRSEPRPFASDWVEITATCYGERSDTIEKDVREREYAASERLMAVLRWCLKSSTGKGWLGAHEFVSWQVMSPSSPGERGCPIAVTFRLRFQFLSPAVPIVEPPLEVVADPVITT